jgi:hypothetical protein
MLTGSAQDVRRPSEKERFLMRKMVRLLVCGVLALTVIGAATGIATHAALAKGKGATAKAAKRQHRLQVLRFVISRSAAYLQVKRGDLLKQLPGHSLAEVAVANNKTAAGLEEALVAAFKAQLDKRLAAQKINQAQYDKRLQAFQNRVDKLVNHVFGSKVAKNVRQRVLLRRAVLRVSANAIGIQVAQLRQELPGHSLADVAAAHSKTAADVQNALVAAAKTKLDKLVANQRIMQARADRLLARFTNRVDDLVSHVWPAKA